MSDPQRPEDLVEEEATLTDDEISTRRVDAPAPLAADDTGDDSGDDSGDTSDTSDTGDDSGA